MLSSAKDSHFDVFTKTPSKSLKVTQDHPVEHASSYRDRRIAHLLLGTRTSLRLHGHLRGSTRRRGGAGIAIAVIARSRYRLLTPHHQRRVKILTGSSGEWPSPTHLSRLTYQVRGRASRLHRVHEAHGYASRQGVRFAPRNPPLSAITQLRG